MNPDLIFFFTILSIGILIFSILGIILIIDKINIHKSTKDNIKTNKIGYKQN